MGANGSTRATWPLLPALLCLIVHGKHTDAREEAGHLSSVKNMLQDIKDKLDDLRDIHFDTCSANIDHKIDNLTVGLRDLSGKFTNLAMSNEVVEDLLIKIEKRLERGARSHKTTSRMNADEGRTKLDSDMQILLDILVPKIDKLLQAVESVESQLWKSSLVTKLDDVVSLVRKLIRRLNACKDKVNGSKVLQGDDFQSVLMKSAKDQEPCHGICQQYAMHLIRKLEHDIVRALQPPSMDSGKTSMQADQAMPQRDSPFSEDYEDEEEDDDVLYDSFVRIQASTSRQNGDFIERDDIIPLLRRLWKKLSSPTVEIKTKLDSIVDIVTNRSSQACDQALKKFSESVSKYPPIFGTDTYSEDMLRILDHKISYVRNLYDRMEAAQTSTHVACNKALTEVERLAATLRNELPPPFAPPRRKPPSSPPRDCEEVQRSGAMVSGVYSIKPEGAKEKFSVYCDLRTDGGGWTVFQRRNDYGEPRQNFTLGWGAYKYGFGDLNEEFWLGNEKLHWLTSQDDVKLRVDLEDFEGTRAYAEYSRFRVLGESAEYQLNVGGYQGNASDSLSLHDGKLFSTFDRDNDEVSSCCNCADTFKGGWWYYKCFEANLNGPYHTNPIDNGYFQGIIWEKWKGDYSLKSSEMKLRPLAFDQWKDP